MNLHRALITALILGGGSLLAACGERPDVSTPAAVTVTATPVPRLFDDRDLMPDPVPLADQHGARAKCSPAPVSAGAKIPH